MKATPLVTQTGDEAAAFTLLVSIVLHGLLLFFRHESWSAFLFVQEGVMPSTEKFEIVWEI